MFKKALLIAAASLLLITFAAAQDEGHFEISLNAAGLLPKQTTGNGIVVSPTKSGAFLGTARYRFNSKHSIQFNYARGNDSQIYTTPNVFRMQSNVTELSGAYVFNPMETKTLEPFVFAGVGSLTFNPFNTVVNTVDTPVPSATQTEFAVLYGGGVDYKIFSRVRRIKNSPVADHVALRLQYRGLFYKVPDFKNPTLFTGSRGHLAEAAIGLAFKF